MANTFITSFTTEAIPTKAPIDVPTVRMTVGTNSTDEHHFFHHPCLPGEPSVLWQAGDGKERSPGILQAKES